MEDIIALFIPIIGMLIPIVWITKHYQAKIAQSSMNQEDYQQLDELNELAEKMAERIKNLETILDAEAPNWRDFDEEKEG